MYKITYFFLFFSWNSLIAQNQIKGRVISEETKLPVAGASVFISNTSRGTSADNNGYFSISNVPDGQHQLVISSIGFETYVYDFSSKQLPQELSVVLHIRSKELVAVTVGPAADPDGWQTWGKLFTDLFIGNSRFAEECRFVNSDALKFRYKESSKKLVAWSDEPLVIENKALGYTIHYQLENFSVDFTNDKLLFLGYPYLEEMKDENGKHKEKWERNRLKAWKGSMKHFMKAAYDNKLKEEGFEVQQLSWTDENTGKNNVFAASLSDSIAMVSNLFRQGGFMGKKEMPLLGVNDFLFPKSEGTRALYFAGFLYIVYKKDLEEINYYKGIPDQKRRSVQRSVIFLANNGKIVEVDEKGNYFPAKGVFSIGYWAWREKMSELLPLDYVPAENKIPGK
ncbi:MAG: carboxypeptidase-like regulatory domain-containing protein [Chitinophagaceae bacterium]